MRIVKCLIKPIHSKKVLHIVFDSRLLLQGTSNQDISKNKNFKLIQSKGN